MGGATLAVRRTLAATRADARPASLRAGDVAVDVVADDRLDVDVVREAEARRLQMTQATDSVPTARQGRPILKCDGVQAAGDASGRGPPSSSRRLGTR